MNTVRRRTAVSNAVFAATVVVLLIIAAVGYGLYGTQTSRTVTSTFTSATTSTVTSTKTSAVTSTSTATATTTLTKSTTNADQIGFTAGFLNGNLTTFVFYKSTPPVCQPSLTQLFQNDKTAATATATTNCEVGAKGTFPSNAVPVWGMVPMFAGLSVFGIPSMGSTPDGFPTYHNQTVLTDCASIMSLRSCPGHPKLLFSPAFTMVQQSMSINNGLMGLPEGVMPFPAHTHIITTDAG